MAIQTFKCKETASLFHNGKSAKFSQIARPAMIRLGYLDAATELSDLKVPPGNRLHDLDKDRVGQQSISINKQFRICFIWGKKGPEDVEIVDYHS